MRLIHTLQVSGGSNSLSARFRRARARRVVELIQSLSAAKGRCRIIDLGGEADYWSLFDREVLERADVAITLVNLERQSADDPLFDTVEGDACDLPQYPDDSFDLVHSNSVIEHVGDWARMERFAREARRLAPAYYVQTPYFWFPIEPHFSAPFFHWRSEQARARFLLKRGYGFRSRPASDLGEAMVDVQHARLLDKAQFRFLFPDAEHVDEKAAGLTKSLIALRRGRT